MSEDFTDEEAADFFSPHRNTTTDESPNGQLFSDEDIASFAQYDAVLNAPDFSTLVKGARTRTAKEYETKVKSVLKSATMASLRRNNLPDAATILKHGPSFSAAAGDLADVSDSTRKMIDMITAPDNPYVMFALAAVPFIAQVFRNHEPQLQQLNLTRKQLRAYKKTHPEEFAKKEDKRRNVELHIPMFRRTVKFRLGFKFNPFKGATFAFRTQTSDPAELVTAVFADQKLIAALKKQGIDVVQVEVPTR